MAEVGSVEFIVNFDNKKANIAIEQTDGKIKVFVKDTEKAEKQTQESTKNMGDAWESLKNKIKGAAITGAVVGIGKAMLNTATEFEKAKGIIAQGTGATGDALNTLFDNAKNVFAELPQDMQAVADGLQDVNTRFGYTGQALENAVKQFGKFAKISNQSISQVSSNASKLANKWKLSGQEVADTLDKITAVAQASGIGIGQLESSLTESSNRLMAMGLSLDESISLLGSLEKYGVNASSAIMAMSMSFVQSGKSGKDAKAEWQSFIAAVKNATSETEANQIAAQKLGTRYAAELLPALRQGALDFNNYAKAIQGANGITEQTFKDSLTSVEKMQMAWHEITSSLSDAFMPIIEELPQLMKDISPSLKEIAGLLKDMLPLVRELVKAAGGAAKEISNAFTARTLKVYAAGLDDIIEQLEKAIETGETFNNIEFSGDFISPKIIAKIEELIFKAQSGKISLEELRETLSQGFGFVNVTKEIDDFQTGIGDAADKIDEFQTNMKALDLSSAKDQIKSIGDAFKDFPSNVQIADMAVQKFASDVSSYLGQFVGGIKQLANNIVSLVVAPFQKEEKLAKDNYDKISKQLDKQLADFSNEKGMEKKILQDMYNEGRMTRDEYLLELEDLNQQELANKQRVEQEKAKAEQEYRAKREVAERKAFEANKKNQYAMAVIDFIKGVAEGYSHGILVGSINAAIMAGVMGTQLALISQQEYTPSFAIGTDRVPETGYALLHKNEAVLNVADANRYRYAEGHLPEQTTPVFNIVLTGNVDVDGSKLADIVLQNWNEAYVNKVGR